MADGGSAGQRQRQGGRPGFRVWPTVCCLLVLVALAGLSGGRGALAAGGHLARIARAGEVRVCIWPDYYGITFRDARTQAIQGIDADMARELAKELGVRLNFIDSSFSRLVDDLGEDRCDVAMFAIGITPERAKHLRFTQPHLQSDIYGIVNRSSRVVRNWSDIDRPGVRVVVTRGTYHEPVMRARLREATLVVVEPPATREEEVESGRSDVFMTDYPYSRRMLETTDWARLVSPPAPFHLTSYAYALAPGDEAWFQRMEGFVQAVKGDGRLLEAARRHRLEAIVIRQ